MSGGEHTLALRQLFAELMQDDQTLRRLVDVLHGNDVRYAMGAMGDEADAHPLTGRMGAGLPLVTERGEQRLAALMHGARPVLLDLTTTPRCASGPRCGATGRHRRCAVSFRSPADALLIRPDGYVAWAGRRSMSWGSRAPALVRRP